MLTCFQLSSPTCCTERKFGRKRLGHYQAKNTSGKSNEDDVGNVAEKSGPDCLRPPPKEPLIKPKAEPEEREGRFVIKCCLK